MEKYLEERRKLGKLFIIQNIKRKKQICRYLSKRDDWKSELLKIALRIVKTNQDIFPVSCNRRGYGLLKVNVKDKKKASKKYHKTLLNTEFAWDKNSFSVTI